MESQGIGAMGLSFLGFLFVRLVGLILFCFGLIFLSGVLHIFCLQRHTLALGLASSLLWSEATFDLSSPWPGEFTHSEKCSIRKGNFFQEIWLHTRSQSRMKRGLLQQCAVQRLKEEEGGVFLWKPQSPFLLFCELLLCSGSRLRQL